MLNISAEASQTDLSGYDGWTLAAALSADGNTITLENSTLTLPPFGAAVLAPGKN